MVKIGRIIIWMLRGLKYFSAAWLQKEKTLLGAAANLLAWTAMKLSVKTSLSRLINN
jgi:hypothetical protein